jgi:hypothetical protein
VSSENRMTKTTKPRLTETANGGYVELDGVRIRWSCCDGRWRVSVESDSGLDVLDVRQERAAVVH